MEIRIIKYKKVADSFFIYPLQEIRTRLKRCCFFSEPSTDFAGFIAKTSFLAKQFPSVYFLLNYNPP